jgi:TolB-like protein/cytochrome c-type biogenesis protein CcmH/NrfG
MPRARAHRVQSFIAELRRRRVFRAALVYVVSAFAALQGADILVPALALPAWTMSLLVVLVLVGFPVVMGLAWAFDVGPGGMQRTPSLEEATSSAPAGVPAGDAAAAIERGRVQPAAPSPRAGVRVTPSVAVVPFLNMSPDSENEYFADGITEDVIAHLSKVRALKVISRTSVMPFKKRGRSLREIGAQLGATALLDGSVRRVGDRVRIVAELVDVETDRHVWAETYDRDLTDIFSIQTDVALQIAAALQAELSPDEQTRIQKEPTANLESYELYLKARHLYIGYTPSSLQRAIQYFGRAIESDPEFALAYAGIAMAYAELDEAGALPPGVARRHATDAAVQALRLDPGLGEAHCAMAHLKSLWEFDWSGADAGFRRALELSPSFADAYDLYGRYCGALGRFDEALALQRRAQELDPLAHRLDVSTTLLRAGRYAEAVAETQRALDFDPDHDRAHATLGWGLFLQGRTAEGIAELERAVALSPGSTQWLAQLGQARGLAGDVAGARAILDQLETRAATDFVAPYNLAYVHTGLGDHERALDLLERAFEERAGAVYAIKGSFLFAPLRPHPRFQALIARLNLPA